MITFGVLVVMIVSLYFFTGWFSKTTGYVLGEDQKIQLAQCLTNNNAILYISSSCYPCDNQLEEFGEDASQYLTVITCDNVDDCPSVPGVPSWYINQEYHLGKINLGDLQELSDCSVE